jgi:uncharacterized peroxidase-related enzyme
MPHIKIPLDLPGIIGPMTAYPKTAKPMNALAEVLLAQETSTFSKQDRELVASYVSFLNQCIFCSETHGAAADAWAKQPGLARQVWESPNQAPISEKLKALLAIAAKVQKDARTVSSDQIAEAKRLGATDEDVHDTVLIAAAFCMFNRYVDGLATQAPPPGFSGYAEMGERLIRTGYERALET